MVFECAPAVKLHPKNVKVGTSANGNPRQDQVTMGRVEIDLLIVMQKKTSFLLRVFLVKKNVFFLIDVY